MYLHRLQHHKFIVGGDGGAQLPKILQLVEAIQMTVGYDIQLTHVDDSGKGRVVEHLPKAILSVNACFWWKGGVAQYGVEGKGSTPDGALSIINLQRSSASGILVFHVQTTEAVAIGGFHRRTPR